jgi:hypothetical protein
MTTAHEVNHEVTDLGRQLRLSGRHAPTPPSGSSPVRPQTDGFPGTGSSATVSQPALLLRREQCDGSHGCRA